MEHISKHLTVVNQELRKLELAQPKSGDEQKFVEAFKSPKLLTASDEEIKEVLRYVMIKIGLRAQNWPNDLEKLILLEHIRQEFGGHRVQEIRLAFDLAISGKLEVEVNCYENFSCLYLTNILFAYRKWSREMYNQMQKEIEKPQVKQLDYVIDPKKEIAELIDLYVGDFKKEKLRLEYVMPSLYDKLVQYGFVENQQIEGLSEKRGFVYNYIIKQATGV